MRLNFSWSGLAVVAAALALPIKAGGCGNAGTACFTLSQAAYDKAGGVCPATGPAIKRFSDDSCGEFGPVSSVDGEGTFDGEFCCYPVTQTDNFFDCGTGGGSFGVGGNSGFGGGVVDTSTSVTGTGGVGGSPGPCFSCNDELDGTSMDPGQLCPAAAMFWSGLNTCNCGSGACQPLCADSACMGLAPSAACKACMVDPSSMGCGSELAACMAN